MTYQIHTGDCLSLLPAVDENSLDAIITDPPYGISLMGANWDHGVPGVAFWRAALRVAKPGAHMAAFGSPRTFHRLACAIEDAGWELRDTCMWVYATGWNKSSDISKAIDKMAGATREVVGYDATRARPNRLYQGGALGNLGGTGKVSDRTDNGATLTAPATDAAKQWEGFYPHLKPAYEPILLFRKPLSEDTIAANVLKWGTGCFNIKACRVAASEQGRQPGWNGAARPHKVTGDTRSNTAAGMYAASEGQAARPAQGRFPANFLHDGSDEVLALFPETTSGTGSVKRASGKGYAPNTFGKESRLPGTANVEHVDSLTGNATRFFQECRISDDDVEAARVFYTAKASGSDRGNEVKGALPLLGVAEETFVNSHISVKPTSLMRYLCRLLTPPGGMILDPFMGSGSTGCAALMEGFHFMGMEREAAYSAIAHTRLAKAIRR